MAQHLSVVRGGSVVFYRSIFDAVRDFLHDEALAGQERVLQRYLKPDLLIIDDMGMKQLPKRSGEYLFEIILRRHELKSTMMTSNRPLEDWGKLLAEPQEDEFAIAALLGGFSLAWAFPRRAGFYNRYLTLRDTSPKELGEWKATLNWFLQKLALKYGKPLLLKSPGHTCRIKVLLEMFPEAKFVHIRRNPFDVFRSTDHLMRTGVTPLWTLQRPDFSDLDDRIIQQYKEVYDAFFEERGLIPNGHFHEVCFEALEADPIGQVQGIYEALAQPDFGHVEAALRRYVSRIAAYKKNALPDVPIEVRSRIEKEWRRCFDEWGYSLETTTG